MDCGLVTGAMTTAGGLGHTLPFLIQTFHVAVTVAVFVVAVELGVISLIRHNIWTPRSCKRRFRWWWAGAVFLTGILIGSS